MTPHAEKFYVTPLKTASFYFDNVDLVTGMLKETAVDYGMGSKMPFSRTYLSVATSKHLPLGNFTHSFDKKLDSKIGYKKELVASSLHSTPDEACQLGWDDIASEVYLGKLEGLKAVYEKETGLCEVYDSYHNLKTTLLIKNRRFKTLASEEMKLLTRSDGTEVLFYQDKKHVWHNTTKTLLSSHKQMRGMIYGSKMVK